MNQQLASISNDYAQTAGQSILDKIAPKTYEPQKPSMSAKLTKVAELFELDVLSEEEALKACKVIIEQHKKVIVGPGMTIKL